MGKKWLFALVGLLAAALLLVDPPSGSQAQEGEIVWQAWESKDMTRLGDDHTGSSFAVSSEVPSPVGGPTLQVTPGGEAAETKVAYLVSGASLQDWAAYGQVTLEVYLPDGNTLNANKFFMGMGDVTGDWAWVDGVMSETEAQPGWNRIGYKPTAAMRNTKADGLYILYLSFFNEGESGKTPLTEAFYLGSIYLSEGAPAQAEATMWAAWENKDVALLEPDNTGSTFATSDAVLTPAGSPTVQLTPGGASEETKLAFPVSGADLQEWAANGQVELEVYLPEENALNANKFFMGMSDVTGEWAWVDGVMSETVVQPGWNTIVYLPTAAMRGAKADGKYYIYLSFFNADENGNKTILTEAFYLGSMALSSGAPVEAAAEPTPPPAAVAPTLVWAAWENKDVALLEPDNTGSTFAASDAVLTPAGRPSVQMTPSGANEETKFAFPVSGADLQDWIAYDQVTLEIYLPEENALNPNKFFLGMSDVTGEWTWVGGVWSNDIEVAPGWNNVVFVPEPNMRQPKADGKYYIYLATMFTDENENKTVLTEPFYLGSMILSLAAPAAPADQIAWGAWENKDITVLGDDKSGSTFALSSDVLTPAGTPALQVMPGGTAGETKIAFKISAADLADWATYKKVELEVYLPPENAMNPNKFFMGMGDLTGEWTWVGGIFGGSAVSLTTGWNRMIYEPLKPMREPKEGGSYELYLSFFFEDASGKPPLTEPFYVGSAYLTDVEVPVTPGTYTPEKVRQAEVDLLLSLDDVGLLDAVAHETFDFFWYEANPTNGLIKDRSTPDSPASIASVGFGLAAIPVAIDRGWITYDQGYNRALVTLNTFASGGVQGDHGFFYHFVSMETGERVWSSELSSIDTTLLIAGALTAGQYFKGTEVETLANQLYGQMDWEWFASGGNFVSMGWKPDLGFIASTWDHFDESLILYVLAIGSPTHPVPVEAWDVWKRPVNLQGEYIYLLAEPLFIYQYPLAYLDLRGQEDAFANYFNNTLRACERNRQFAADNEATFTTYAGGIWGISASDGPSGYRAYGATGGNHDGTIAPYASIACLPFMPEASVEAMRAMLTKYGTKVWGEYGFVSAINEDRDWYSAEHIGIDQGDILLMITNYQDGLVWDLFMQNEHVQPALASVGFVESTGDYAVTPAYLEAFRLGN